MISDPRVNGIVKNANVREKHEEGRLHLAPVKHGEIVEITALILQELRDGRVSTVVSGHWKEGELEETNTRSKL